MSLHQQLDRLKKGWRALSLYRQCVRPGNLCFDIGANHGSRSVIFTFLGARTIAIEPNAGLTGKLRRFPRVTVVNQAVSDKPGHATMSFNRNDQISSLNPEWRKNWPEFPDWYEREVECVTFDQLIARYGLPNFCKIDVEGYEATVLGGLTQRVPMLSFEATPHVTSNTEKCLAILQRLGEYEYNFAVGDDFQWLSPQWESAEKIVQRITEAGDIYARAKNRS
jgi:FkbM family methyltransferase